MNNMLSPIRVLSAVALFVGSALMVGCSSPAPVTRTTTTEQTTVTPTVMAPVPSDTTTTTTVQRTTQ
jgi:hypothetical protein